MGSPLHPCPDCGQPISRYARACPYCGRPRRTPGQRLLRELLAKIIALALVGLLAVWFFKWGGLEWFSRGLTEAMMKGMTNMPR